MVSEFSLCLGLCQPSASLGDCAGGDLLPSWHAENNEKEMKGPKVLMTALLHSQVPMSHSCLTLSQSWFHLNSPTELYYLSHRIPHTSIHYP